MADTRRHRGGDRRHRRHRPGGRRRSPSQDVYVAPHGNDHAAGDARHPVRTLARAQDLVRQRDHHLAADLTVHLADGTYRLDHPLTLDSRDSGSGGHQVVWQGSGKAVISGGKQVTGWHQVTGHSGLWAAPAPRGLSDTRQLYVDGVRATRAAGQVPVTLTKTATGYTAASDTLAKWPDIAGAEFVYTSGETLWNMVRDGLGQWTQPRCDVASASGTTVTMVQPCWDNSNKRVEFPDIPGRTVSMVGPGALTNGAHVTYMENARELLDTPGEWYLDRAAHTVYYMPRKGEDLHRADVEAPALEKLVDGRGTAAAPLHDVAFRGLQFSYATWLTPPPRRASPRSRPATPSRARPATPPRACAASRPAGSARSAPGPRSPATSRSTTAATSTSATTRSSISARPDWSWATARNTPPCAAASSPTSRATAWRSAAWTRRCPPTTPTSPATSS